MTTTFVERWLPPVVIVAGAATVYAYRLGQAPLAASEAYSALAPRSLRAGWLRRRR